MLSYLHYVAWIVCIVYSTIPAFWLMIHPFADKWRAHRRSPYKLLLPLWIAIWIVAAWITLPWLHIRLYQAPWTWALAIPLFLGGFYLYSKSGKNFTASQLGGIPEILRGSSDQRLIVDGIRSRIRHPVYLAHLCELLAWSIGTGLAVCWALTAFAGITGAAMIRLEDAELERRFGETYRIYRNSVPAVLPRVFRQRQL